MIYCVEDDDSIRELMLYALRASGFEAEGFRDSVGLFDALSHAQPQLIMLDIMLPGMDGIEILKALRGNPATARIPVIIASARGTEYDKVVGLDLGADDYLAKPFNPRELLARIKAVLRRANLMPEVQDDLPGKLYFDHWQLDMSRRELIDEQGVSISLSTAEFDLLKVFLERPKRVLSRDQLLDLARGREAQAFDRAIDTLVSRLRRKLELDPKKPELIKTVWGGGYMFSAEVRHDN